MYNVSTRTNSGCFFTNLANRAEGEQEAAKASNKDSTIIMMVRLKLISGCFNVRNGI
jgi:hypothetical protein